MSFLRSIQIMALIGLCALIFTISMTFLPEKKTTEKKPNILVIILDDLGINDLSRNNSELSTPNLDKIASQGLYFTNHYADATCSPTRSSYMTGKFSVRTGYMSNGLGLDSGTKTLPIHFKSEGYSTHHIGKWHLGHTTDAALPKMQGYDSFYGFLSQWLLRKPHSSPIAEQDYRKPTYNNPWIEDIDGNLEQIKGHLTNILAQQVVQEIEEGEQGDKPWFINYWMYAPHTPIEPTKESLSFYDNSPTGKYKALLRDLDNAIGVVDEALHRTSQYKNTIVVIVSDNGGTNKAYDNNYPYNGKKTQYLQGGTKTPLFIRWPETIPKGERKQIVSTIDLYPTIAALIDSPIQHEVDGIDISQAIFSNSKLPDRKFIWGSQTLLTSSASILDTGKMVRLTYQSPSLTSPPIKAFLDLEADPTGYQNKIDSEDPRIEELNAELSKELKEATLIETQEKQDDSHILLSGNDLRRTPGFTGFTYSSNFIPNDSADDSSLPTSLVSQKGAWQATYSKEKSLIKVKFKNVLLEGKIRPSTESCQTMTISIYNNRRLNNWKGASSKIRAELYINGVLADSSFKEDNTIITTINSKPTVVARYNLLGKTDKTKLYHVAIPYFSITAENLHKELCKTI